MKVAKAVSAIELDASDSAASQESEEHTTILTRLLMTITFSVTSPGSVILFHISPSSYIRLQLIDAMYDSVRHQPYISFSGATSNSNPKPQGIRTTSRETGTGFLFLTSAWGPSYYGLVLSLSWSVNSLQLVQLWPCSRNNIEKSPGESP